ncbi:MULTISPECIES: phage tail assembly protein [Halomonas]|uniref:phage tail assembly protein n=1 Tax=Halomonas TaxID=2745 RepID=UPI001CD6699E|nr:MULTISPECIES: phage tail assembly protein [Halomonas]MCA0918529.1 phage tail assembly protein [Halomonas denitrificans]
MEDKTQDTTAPLPQIPTETVELDTPFTRGKRTIGEIQVRKPKAGALRGVALTDLLQMEVSALTKVLPRITEPALTEAEVRELDPADLVQLGGTVAGFLVPRKTREATE